MIQRVLVFGCVAVLACVVTTWAGSPVTSATAPSGAVSVAPLNVAPMPAPVRALVRDAEGRFVRAPVVARAAASGSGPLVGFEVDPATGEVKLVAPDGPVADGVADAKANISGSFDLDSVTCTNCGGCPALGDRTLTVVLLATQEVPAESYGVSDLVSTNYTLTGVVHTVPALEPGDLLPITISGDIGVCGTFRVYFDMCDTPPEVPTDPCVGGGVPELAGSYAVSDGPYWPDAPPTYSCREACALLFGGVESIYRCSVDPSSDPASITDTGWYSGFGDGQYCALGGSGAQPDGWKVNTVYTCCPAYSAYVRDWCIPGYGGDSINYCWRLPPG
jgi:hypothetical protein